jgi:hypothetical protein
VWSTLALAGIDSIVIPAHSSQFTQPLDLSFNGNFKSNLQDIQGLPKKSKMKTDLEIFIKRLIDCIYNSLKPSSIRKGFHQAHLLFEENNIQKLREDINNFLDTIPLTCPLGVYLFVYFYLFNIFFFKKKNLFI